MKKLYLLTKKKNYIRFIKKIKIMTLSKNKNVKENILNFTY